MQSFWYNGGRGDGLDEYSDYVLDIKKKAIWYDAKMGGTADSAVPPIHMVPSACHLCSSTICGVRTAGFSSPPM